jgi:hypothetical protein
MIFNVEVKTAEETLERGDLLYEKRQLLRVERVSKPRGKNRRISVKFRIIGKINLDRQLATDRAVPGISNADAAARYRSLCK